MSDSKTTGRKKRFWTKRNTLDVIYASGVILSLILSAIPHLSPWLFPIRARLTLLVDHTVFVYSNVNPSLIFEVSGNVVNDSPLSAAIIGFDVTFNYDKPYDIISQSDNYGSSLLISSGQTSFNLSRTLIGRENTALPDNTLRSVIISVQYQDDIGIQEATREYGYF